MPKAANPNEMPPLSALSSMSMNHLLWLKSVLRDLSDIGERILDCDIVPEFDLTPGQVVSVRLGDLMVFAEPELTNAEMAAQAFAAQQKQFDAMTATPPEEVDVQAIVNAVFADMDRAAQLKQNPPPAVPDADGAAVEPAPAVVVPTAGADATPYDGLDFPDAGAAEDAPDPVPSLDPVAPPPAAVVEPSPAARATVAGDVDPAKPAPWTAEEDDRLVQLVAEAMADGEKLNRAAAAAANVLGRPEEGTKYRVYNKVKDRVYDALGQLKKPTAEQTTPEPARQLAGADAVGRAGGASQPAPGAPKAEPKPAPKPPAPKAAPVPPADLPPELASAAAHLRSVTPFGKWTPTMDRDLLRELVDLRWPLHEVCLDLGVSTIQAHQRLHTLTKGKALKNAEIWAAMQALGYGVGAE